MTTAVKAPTDPNVEAATAVEEYARAVVDGDVLANHYVRLAGERHLADLAAGEERGLRFDPARAGRAIRFFSFLRLAEGDFAGRPFTLQGWQAFIVGSVFGWFVEDPDGGARAPHGATAPASATRRGMSRSWPRSPRCGSTR